jgi:hypothetical protein
MLSLPERIEFLEKDLLTNHKRIIAYHDLQFAIFYF